MAKPNGLSYPQKTAESPFKRGLNEKCDESHTTFPVSGCSLTPELNPVDSTPRPLGSTLTVNGATYHQVERSGQIAIYEGPLADMFEVIVIQVKPPSICPSGAVAPWREVYPVAEQWGTYGWTYTSASHREPLNAARESFKDALAYGARN